MKTPLFPFEVGHLSAAEVGRRREVAAALETITETLRVDEPWTADLRADLVDVLMGLLVEPIAALVAGIVEEMRPDVRRREDQD